MSLSRSTGKFKLVENGKITAEKYSTEIVQYMEKIPIKVKKHLISPALSYGLTG